MPQTGYNWNWPSGYQLGKAPFNTVTDVTLSDNIPSAGGGTAQVTNYTIQGATWQSDDLIDAVIYLLFLDGIQWAQIALTNPITDLDPSQKEFTLDPATGIITFSIPIDDPVLGTILYASSGTAILPPTEPITVQQFKDYAKIDTGSIDDAIISEMITAAREQCEDYAGVSIIARSVTALLNNSCGGIYLPYCPFISLTSITDSNGDAIVTDNYKLSNKYNSSLYFPQLVSPADSCVTLVYTAGYGIAPAKFILAIKQQTFFLYENRGELALIGRSGQEADVTMSPQAKATLSRLRRVG